MQTRSSSKFVGEPSTNPISTNPKRRNRRRSKPRIEPISLEETPAVTMADQRTMAELLRAPTEGYAEAIVSKVCNSRNKPIASQVKASNVDSLEIANAVTSAMTAMFKQHQVTTALASVKAVKESCVTYGSAHSYRQCPATNGNTFSGYQDNFQEYVSVAANTASTSGSGSISSNTIANLRGDLKVITTQSGVSYDGPPVPPPFSSLLKVMEWVPEVTKDTVQSSTENIQPPVAQTQVPIDEPVVA
nr:reverse transcriptase domain-containing protein [Tanacetum cinerariifolium]